MASVAGERVEDNGDACWLYPRLAGIERGTMKGRMKELMGAGFFVGRCS